MRFKAVILSKPYGYGYRIEGDTPSDPMIRGPYSTLWGCKRGARKELAEMRRHGGADEVVVVLS